MSLQTGLPTLRDVARAAGVSAQTVSRVLNDSPRVRPATREQVLHAVADLGYRPNEGARELARLKHPHPTPIQEPAR